MPITVSHISQLIPSAGARGEAEIAQRERKQVRERPKDESNPKETTLRETVEGMREQVTESE